MTDLATAGGPRGGILVALDGSPLAESIVPTVRALARRLGAELVLLHVVHVPMAVPTTGVGLDEIVEQQTRRARSYLHRLEHDLKVEGIPVRTVVAVGDTAPEIVRCAERERIDLVALATHGRSGMQRWLYGSVADAVLHTVTRPLLLLRPSGEAAPAVELGRLVVALDGSPLAEQALGPARDLARALAVPLVLLHVVDVMQSALVLEPHSGSDYGRILAMLEENAERYLAEVADRERQHGLTVETVKTTGTPAEVIARYGTSHPDGLLVLGTHGRTGWRAAVLGSVARRVLLMAEGPVLLLRATPPAA